MAFHTYSHIKKESGINPTGIYELTEDIMDGESAGYSGKIIVKQIEKDKFVVNLDLCKGNPGYNTGNLSQTP